MIFLLDYDQPTGALVRMQTFQDSEVTHAEDARLALELAHFEAGITREVVLLEAASEHIIRRTHRRYFESLRELLRSETPAEAA